MGVLLKNPEINFKRTTAINKLGTLRKRIKVVPGGTSAGKTYGIIPLLVNKAIKNPNLEISIVSESIPHLKRGAMKDFLKIMKDTKRFVRKQWHGTDFKYTFSNGSYIEFFSADQSDKVRGPRRDVLYINECNNLPWDTYHQLAIRTNHEIWMDFNPSNEFWVHEELQNDDDAEWLTLTYKDNEALAPSIVKEIEKSKSKAFHDPSITNKEKLFALTNIKNKYWSNWWKVYGLGEVGILEGVVFSNWSIIEGIPEEAEYIGSSIDFGYANDPTSVMDAYKYNGQIIWDQAIYQKGLKNGDIAQLLKFQGKDNSTRISAESAEPKSIDEINAYGFNLEAVEKGPDSINFGISIMQEDSFLVTSRSLETITELRRYCWDEDKTGKKLNRPIDAFNHSIDAMRYYYMTYLANKQYTDTQKEDEAYKRALQLFN